MLSYTSNNNDNSAFKIVLRLSIYILHNNSKIDIKFKIKIILNNKDKIFNFKSCSIHNPIITVSTSRTNNDGRNTNPKTDL